jgi:ABC-type uncharacterized transport system permease subunit
MLHDLLQPDVLVFLIPIVAIVTAFGTGIVRLVLNYQKRKDMFALYHQERMAAIEKGIEMPPLPEDFFREDGKPSWRSSHRTLLTGLVLTFIGLTLYLAMHLNHENGAAYAMIPGGIGAAFLIYYFTAGRKIAAAMEEERKAKLAAMIRDKNPNCV